MDPVLNGGFVHTTEDRHFEARNPQCAMKVAQPKVTITKRGRKGKVKDTIVISEKDENYFIIHPKKFLMLAQALNHRISKRTGEALIAIHPMNMC